MNTMKETTPTSTRVCRGYDPKQFMAEFCYENGRSELYLEVKYRVDWFNHWCQESGVEGYILDAGWEIIPGTRMIVATSVVMIDGKEAARAIAGRYIPDDIAGMNTVVQSVFTCAKGRALANLGFGTTNGSYGENGEDIPADAGIPIPTPAPVVVPPVVQPPATAHSTEAVAPVEEQPVATEEVTPKRRGRKPKAVAPAEETTPASEPAPIQEPAREPVVAPPQPAAEGIPQTLEEARAFVCPVGKYRSRSLGEIFMTDKTAIQFYAGEAAAPYGGANKHPGLVAAAKILWAQTQMAEPTADEADPDQVTF